LLNIIKKYCQVKSEKSFNITINKRNTRLIKILLVILFYAAAYYLVNFINHFRGPSVFYNFNTYIDNLIPYVGWTWIFYVLAYLYFSVWASTIISRLSEVKFNQALNTYILMMITGCLIQIIFPATAPWPQNQISFQRVMHEAVMLPYACLPSMHVALTVLTALLAFSAFESALIRTLSTIFGVFIIISTITIKEHFFLDALTGFVLGAVYYLVWKMGIQYISKKNEEKIRVNISKKKLGSSISFEKK